MSATAPPKVPRGAGVTLGHTSLAAGSLLAGKYRVESLLGQGGMATVVAARHETLGHRVALKVLQPELMSAPGIAKRALREARAAAALTSEHVVRVHDVGELESGEPYIVMDLLEGVDLARLLQQRGPLPLQEVASYLVQACDAIVEAHQRGIVHRDLKPSNLFLTHRRDGSPVVKLMDFGISKVVEGDRDEPLTTTNDSLGTPHYMSPEQLLTSKGVDARTDVWALGVILYRLLTGKHAFNGETTPAVHIAIALESAPKIRDLRPDLPEDIEALVQRCLAKSREERLQTASEFAAVLMRHADAELMQRSPISLPQVAPSSLELSGPTSRSPVTLAPPSSVVSPEGSTHATWGGSKGPQVRPRRRGIAAVALVLVAGIGAAAFVVARRPPSTPTASNTAAEAPHDTAAAAATIEPVESAALAPSAAASNAAPPTSALPEASAGKAAMSPRPPARLKAPPHPSTSAAKGPDPYGDRR